MPHKGYQQNVTAYARPPCAQQSQNVQQYIPYTVPIVPNNVYNPPGQNMYDMVYGHQSVHRNQPSYSQNSLNIYPEHVDNAWINEPRVVSDVKLLDKMETVEITSKDLSPASFCSNLDLFLPEFYKSKEPHYNKMQESQWFYNANYNLKYNEYPSCAQFNCDDATVDRTVKYCSIQKQNNFDKSASVSTCIYNDGSNKFFSQENQCDYVMCNQSDKVQNLNLLNGSSIQQTDEFYPQNQILCPDALHFPPIENINPPNEGSNDESDIIVEESEEEVTDYSEDLEKRLDYTAYCIVCNVLYISSGNQFYTLTKDLPLTMSTRQPVHVKLTEIVGKINNKSSSYLCSHCLGLINTIDHLQYKLDSCKCELLSKFNSTNGTNYVSDSKGPPDCKTGGTQKPKNSCKHTFNCKLCKKMFSLKKYYAFHMFQHKYKTRYLCEICGKQFGKASKFTVHLKTHAKTVTVLQKRIKIDAFLCRICKKPFRTKSNLREHENYCSGRVPYVCKYTACAKKFPASTKLKYHVKLKHDKKFGSICSICNIGFIRTSDHKAHMVSHSTNKKFHCPKCDKSYKTASNLNFHMKFHDSKMPFVCDICDKGFMRKEYLESHVNKHNGIKSFACQFCDKKFVSQKNLDAHLKYHDGSVKKKKCNICGKLISTSLEDHIRTHNNLREFSCNVCDMKFNTRSALAKHKKRIHSSEIVKKIN